MASDQIKWTGMSLTDKENSKINHGTIHSIVPADDLAPLGVRTSEEAVTITEGDMDRFLQSYIT